MATASRTTTTIPKVIETIETVTSITLDLSLQEAMFLRGLLFNHIAGPNNGPRGLSNAIGQALRAAGVQPANYRVTAGGFTPSLEYPDQPLLPTE